MLLPGSEDVLMEMEPKGVEPVGNNSVKGDAESDTDAANTSTQDSSISNGDEADDKQEMVELKIIWNKNKYDLKIPLDNTGANLKESIHSLTGKVAGKPASDLPWSAFQMPSVVSPGLPPAMQKVMYKGLLPEDKTLRDIKITNGAKIMVVGSTINDVLAVNTPKEVIQQEVKAEENKKEPLCRQKVGFVLYVDGWFLSVCLQMCPVVPATQEGFGQG